MAQLTARENFQVTAKEGETERGPERLPELCRRSRQSRNTRQIDSEGQSTRKGRAEQRKLWKLQEVPLCVQQNAPLCMSVGKLPKTRGRTIRKD